MFRKSKMYENKIDSSLNINLLDGQSEVKIKQYKE